MFTLLGEMRLCYRMTWFLLALLCKFFVTATSQELPFCTDNESGSGALQASGSVHPSCIPITRDSELRINSGCFPYFPEGKCLTFNYLDGPEDFADLSTRLDFLDGTLSTSQSVSDYCTEALRAYVCNYVYPGCDPLLGQPQGICESECILFTTGECERFFMDAVEIAQTTSVFRLTTMCNNTLDFVEASNPDLLFNSSMNCWNITGVINETSPNPNNISSGSSNNFVKIVTSVSSGIILLAAGVVLISWLYVKRRKRQRQKAMLMFANATNVNGGSDILSNVYHFDFSLEDLTHIQEHDYDQVLLDRAQLEHGTKSPYALFEQALKSTVEETGTLKKLSREMIIPSSSIHLRDVLGQGECGIVYKGHLLEPQRRTADSSRDRTASVLEVVAVKTLKGFHDQSQVSEMLRESIKMRDFDHPNVLNLIGVCLDGGPAPYIVLPFMANGSLHSYLKKERPNLLLGEEAAEEQVSAISKRLLDMCIQIAKGMEYLASRNFVHRDLAARNCMMDAHFVIKVADFGLSENMHTKMYFRQEQDTAVKLPIKWLAVESMTDGVFSEKTDVWAFGVTCWEVYSAGKTPYPGVAPKNLLGLLENGHRLEKPSNTACCDEMYSIMLSCWNANPEERPPFSELVNKISGILEPLADYMDFSSFALSSQDAGTNATEGANVEIVVA